MATRSSAPAKQNWFNTLNEALISEDLLEAWDLNFAPIQYGQTFSWIWDDGTKYGRFISIYRNENGRYERPITYRC